MAASAMKHMSSNFFKLDKFERVDFRRWQKKMHFLLSSMSVVYVLTTLILEDGGNNVTVEQIRKRAKWDNDNYVCRGLILNGMSNSLFDVYQNVKSSKELWDSLEAKYMAENASSKKFLVSNFTNYKMTDSRPVMEQYNELLGILGRFTQHKINMDVAIQDNDKAKGNNVVDPFVVNMVKHNNSSRYNDNKGKRKHHDNIKANPNKLILTRRQNLFVGNVAKLVALKWIAKVVMLATKLMDCKGGKVGNKANSSGTNGSVDGSANSLKGQNMFNKSFQVYYVTNVSEAYFVQDGDVAWWVNSGATVFMCKDRCWFKTYKSLNDGSTLHMGNESTALVHGRGCVDLRISSGKIILLNIVNDNIASAFMSTSKLNDSILWHARLGHVHFKRMQDMSKDGLIPAFDIDTEKCKTCMLAKITKKPFQNVKRKTEVLELIHSDLCDLHAITPPNWVTTE
ncbi:zinc finger, CCHC-type containing protein [Tanacetum coccineum]